MIKTCIDIINMIHGAQQVNIESYTFGIMMQYTT